MVMKWKNRLDKRELHHIVQLVISQDRLANGIFMKNPLKNTISRGLHCILTMR